MTWFVWDKLFFLFTGILYKLGFNISPIDGHQLLGLDVIYYFFPEYLHKAWYYILFGFGCGFAGLAYNIDKEYFKKLDNNQ